MVLPEPLKARALMRPYALLHIYRGRLRVHAAQEMLAGVGVAVAVALVFATLIANGSLAGSAAQVLHTVVGPANLQLRARSPDGFDERLLPAVGHLPGVKLAAPLLEQDATICAPHAHCVAIDLAGTNVSLAILDELAHTLPLSTLQPGGIALTKTTANQLDVGTRPRDQPVSLSLRGKRTTLQVAAILGPEEVGALSQAFVATMPLTNLQHLAGLPGRVTRILVQTQPGRQAQVSAELRVLAHGRLTIALANQDLALLHQALRPSGQASAFFAAIAGLLGFLFAFNAMLLTVPERRQTIADLRLSGTRRTAIVQLVLFQALCLGIAASLLGLLAGYALSTGLFHQSAGYLAQAFTLGGDTVVGLSPVLLSFLGGVLATCLASTVPLLDLRRARALDAVYHEEGEPGNTLALSASRNLAYAAGGLLAAATAILILLPSLALPACIVLALTVVLAIPLTFTGVLHAAQALTRRNDRLTILPIALMSLKATTLRSLALAATGAVALFGSVALGGARDDLLRGIEGYIHGYVSGASIWIVNPTDPTAVEPLPRAYAERLSRIPGVSKVDSFQDTYLNLGGRRIWVLARPAPINGAILKSQIVDGNATVTAARIKEGGWITVSEQIATEHHTGVGDMLTLPTPSGEVPFKVAATTTNLTWSPGAVLMSTTDYDRVWRTSAPTALGVDLRPGTNVQATIRTIERTLGPANGTEALTPGVRATRTSAVAREGLSKLNDISTLLLLAAILAIAAALTSAIWQRRPTLAGLRLAGTPPHHLRRILLTEAVLILTAACLIGAVAGLYGQVIIDSYLRHVTGFPVAHIATGWRPLDIFALVIAAVLAIVSFPGWLASRVAPKLALEGE
jgi:putative ABC transport system permease protein